MLPVIKKNRITNMFKKINTLLSIINDIIILDDNTVGVTLDKNLVIYNNKNNINICKGYHVTIAGQIHNNPKISLEDFYKNPSKVQGQIDESVKRENEQLIEQGR